MNVLLFIVILLIVCALIGWLLSTLPLPAPWGALAHAALVLFAILMLISILFGLFPVPQIWSTR